MKPPDMSRALDSSRDLDWAPAGVRWIRGALVAVLFAPIIGLSIFCVVKLGLWLVIVPAAGGAGTFAWRIATRAARAMVRARLARFAGGRVDLAAVRARVDGEIVHVRGRVRADRTVRGLGGEERGVYRRTVLHAAGVEMIDEEAVDFSIVADGSLPVRARVDRAQLLAADPPRRLASPRAARRLRELGVPSIEVLQAARAVYASETVLRDGDAVEVVGVKGRALDRSLAERLPREAPLGTTIEGTDALPLLIVPVPD